MKSPFSNVFSELQRGMRLAKCRKCGCMHTTLENLRTALPKIKEADAKELLNNVKEWKKGLEPMAYSCFKCKFCIPPEAMSLLTAKYPSITSSTLSTCEFEVNKTIWPPVAGEYTVLKKSAPVAVSTLSSDKLSEDLVKRKPAGLCITGKTETENIGIDKIVKNVVTNPAISFLIVAGKEPEGHKSGETLLALWEHGVNKDMRVIGSAGRRPILKNVTQSEIDTFRKQIHVENMIGCEDVKLLAAKIEVFAEKAESVTGSSCGCRDCHDQPSGDTMETNVQAVVGAPKVKAAAPLPKAVKLDRAGYFVILPSRKTRIITVEHYSYDNKLLRIIEGKDSREIYFTLINNKWVTDMAHAAYMGKELGRAELSLSRKFKFVQDGA